MDQLENFREQLKQRSRPGNKDPQEPPAPEKKMRKKKEPMPGRASVWIPKESILKVKLLSIWIEAEGIREPSSVTGIIADAIDYYIDKKYPQAKDVLNPITNK